MAEVRQVSLRFGSTDTSDEYSNYLRYYRIPVTGGATLMAKGIGKGVMHGDGKAVVSGIAKGAKSVGSGVGQGVESAVMGAADGVITCGEGLATGVKSIGQGFASAFTGGKRRRRDPRLGDGR